MLKSIEEIVAVRYTEGCTDTKTSIVRNSLAEGLPIEVIQKITGLDINTIQGLSVTQG